MNIIMLEGSTISSADCPVCGGNKKMYQEIARSWLLYMCQKCGYGNYFTCKRDDNGKIQSLKWNRRHERNRFAKFINVRTKHGLPWTGKTLFYPLEENCDQIGIRPIAKKNKLRWRACYYSHITNCDLFVGEFNTYGAAWEATLAFEAEHIKSSKKEKGKKAKK